MQTYSNNEYKRMADIIHRYLEYGIGDNFEALKNIPFDTYKFKVITFEHDHYRNEYAAYDLMDRSRQFFNSIGYFKVPDNISSSYYTNINLSEDWYIHPELVDISEYQ